MSRRTSVLLAGLLILPLATPAQGSGFGLGARYSFIRNHSTHDNSSTMGLMARLRGNFLGAEGTIDYRDDDLDAGGVQKTWPVTASLMLYPIPIVYGLAGLGWYHTSVSFPEGSPYANRSDSKLGYHFGAGVELPLVPTLKLTGDFRYLFLNYKLGDIPSSVGRSRANAYSLNAGVIIYLK
ncbi:MAG: outer membrane beta-barrel protein [candidate division Zixibacteria bacterium]|nr:outer membrane beta-barrel protein [candidate division Zixibacteria bacterium]